MEKPTYNFNQWLNHLMVEYFYYPSRILVDDPGPLILEDTLLKVQLFPLKEHRKDPLISSYKNAVESDINVLLCVFYEKLTNQSAEQLTLILKKLKESYELDYTDGIAWLTQLFLIAVDWELYRSEFQ